MEPNPDTPLGIAPRRYRDAVSRHLMDSHGYTWGELQRCQQRHRELIERERCRGVPAQALAAQIARLDAGGSAPR